MKTPLSVPAAGIERAEHADRHGDDQNEQEAQRHERNRHRQILRDLRHDQAIGHPGRAERALQQSRLHRRLEAEIDCELGKKRPVEAELVRRLRVSLRARVHADEAGDRIGRQQADDKEDPDDEAYELQDSEAEPFGDVAHKHRLPRLLGRPRMPCRHAHRQRSVKSKKRIELSAYQRSPVSLLDIAHCVLYSTMGAQATSAASWS